MDITTALLPTTVLAVEAKLLAEAANSSTYLGIADNDAAGRYAFLLGMCEAKLAEANREYLRLIERTAVTKAALDVLGNVHDFLDDQSDVIDGDDGPLPNRAMSLLGEVSTVLDRSKR